MEQVAVIADDLTGASDTGVQFSKYGLSTMVVIAPHLIKKIDERKDIWSINTDSRSLTEPAAYTKVREIVEELQKRGIKRFYKKIDSTLRGNPGAEMEAILDALGSQRALLVPAFPANGRLILNGVLVVEGKPTVHVPSLLQTRMSRKIGELDFKDVGTGPSILAEKIQNLYNTGCQVVVVDTAQEEDLQTIAATVSLMGQGVVVAGAAGLAAYLPETWGLRKSNRLIKEVKGTMLLIAGSANPLTDAQVRQAVEFTESPLLKLSPHSIQERGIEFEIDRVSQQAYGLIKAANSTSMLAIGVDQEENNETQSMDNKVLGEVIATALGEVTRRIVKTGSIAGLMITGGDTAAHVCRSLSAWGIELLSETLPGIPFGRMVGGVWNGMPILTKAGGFGSPDTFARLIQFFSPPEVHIASDPTDSSDQVSETR